LGRGKTASFWRLFDRRNGGGSTAEKLERNHPRPCEQIQHVHPVEVHA